MLDFESYIRASAHFYRQSSKHGFEVHWNGSKTPPKIGGSITSRLGTSVGGWKNHHIRYRARKGNGPIEESPFTLGGVEYQDPLQKHGHGHT